MGSLSIGIPCPPAGARDRPRLRGLDGWASRPSRCSLGGRSVQTRLAGNVSFLISCMHAVFGLRTASVAGQVTGDSLMVDRQSGALLSYHIGPTEVMTVPQAEGGVRTVPSPASLRQRRAFADEQAVRIARTAWELETFLGAPTDPLYLDSGTVTAIGVRGWSVFSPRLGSPSY